MEQPDINLYEEEEEDAAEAMELDAPHGVDHAADGHNGVNGVNGVNGSVGTDDELDERTMKKKKKSVLEPAHTTKSLTLTYEEYKKVSNLLVLHLLKEESKIEGVFWPLRIVWLSVGMSAGRNYPKTSRLLENYGACSCYNKNPLVQSLSMSFSTLCLKICWSRENAIEATHYFFF